MKNFFEIFSLPQSFVIDQSKLEKKYLEFQQRFHPDKSSFDDISKSIEINEAYKILSDDFLRACHLLQLKGIDILHDEKAVRVDISTLEEQLELQEKISEISKNEIDDLRKKLNSDFKKLIMEAMQEADINASAQFLTKAKYFKKSLEDLKIRKLKLVDPATSAG
ncbi:MAG: Fe-S protein assembly co-chaperone HscB [Alphaproteobacteria bacterium RIFCSPLOWO2_01_FULL_40_26]|nr:MAG: Fe-S protein assembly co-chaperone HscB [Alphaproteobacteria bacterium RIFCSPHIGHO2_02_FULL_40_34]OFW86940.1 MAG: Fe-S protein assembly co-chaperone HscB [Alphaproteobacteria bacterium RIFCSPHIGHO2_01_FULL_40_8]OFW94450.1 MAG: Fe-S protein assembly co-chaperone HscB [Alphaproteobacteria bacterium RIFCSPLOWO2_01_FULL_40_26]OFX09520.1 MAG: Fe-S protein assembly co-chaperone HscB [Alphaproteobacteria bacterium RIFCSPLOWO2_02_FULL_40_19]OFX10670.1 MAG: Fe-S protein assembly co-chaperone Hsc